jgi:hypothetical protein
LSSSLLVPVRLAKLLQGRLYFAFALRKRASSDTLSADRVSVGRARARPPARSR